MISVYEYLIVYFIVYILKNSLIGYYWGASSNGRALASHARGNGIDARVLQLFSF